MTIPGWEIPVTGPPPSRDFDRVEAARAMRTLWLPGELYALQGLPSGRWEVASLDDVDHALGVVRELAGGKGVYTTVNPLRRGFVRGDKRGFTNDDFERRAWFFLDVDPASPLDGEGRPRKNVNATDVEKAAALEVSGAIQEHAERRGWPAPVFGDSGNGFHHYWSVVLGNDKFTQQVLRGVLRAWAALFDTALAHVDVGVHDIKRIAKLPGTWARKGPDSPDRPHRMAKILVAPDIEPVSLDILKAELEPASRKAIVPPPPAGWSIPVKPPGGTGYAAAALEAEARKVEGTTERRVCQLYEAALKVGGYVGGGELSEAEVVARLTAAGRNAGLGTDGDPQEIERAIRNGLGVGMATPKNAPTPKNGKASANGQAHANGQAPPPDVASLDSLVKLAGDYERRPVRWLWPNWIPMNKLTTLAGSGGLGKSFVCCDLAARVSTGGEIPGGGGECFERGKVLIINCEDDPEDTTVPRLFEVGADLSMVGILRSEAVGIFTLADVEMIKRAVAEMGGVSLIIIDPATAFVGQADDHKNAQLQALLTPLRIAAWELGAAIILVTHVNKSSGNNVEAAMRVVGGVAWVNAVRAAVIFAKDPDDPSRRLMLPFKTNNGPEQKGMAYRVVPTDTLARVDWEGEVDTTADEAMQGSKGSKHGPECKLSDDEIEAVFRGLFAGRNEVASKEGEAACKAQGVSFRKMKEFKKRLEIRSRQLEDGWIWIAPYSFRSS